MEFALDDNKIDTRNINENLWLHRAAQSLTEVFRLSLSKELDIDFSELVTGYRIRRSTVQQKTFVDIYVYDSLSGGAGYSVKIESEIKNLFKNMKELLSSCDCASACDRCLKHYLNQHAHGKLDRFYALNLLNWGISGKIDGEISFDTQCKYFDSVKNILNEDGYTLSVEDEKFYISKCGITYEVIVYPSMQAEPCGDGKIFICDSFFKYAKPYVLDKIRKYF